MFQLKFVLNNTLKIALILVALENSHRPSSVHNISYKLYQERGFSVEKQLFLAEINTGNRSKQYPRTIILLILE